MSNFRRKSGFTFVELMLVIVIMALLASFTGSYYVNSYKKSSLKSTAQNLLLMGKYAKIRSIEQGQTCKLYLDSAHKQFYLLAPMTDGISQTTELMLVSNPYCRKVTLDDGVEFEYLNFQSAMDRDQAGYDSEYCINFYPNGCCDSATIQIGNGKDSMTAVFSSANAKATIYEGPVDAIEIGAQVIDLDVMN